MAPSVAPPTPQEIQRKLSVHSSSRAKPSTTTTHNAGISSSYGGTGGLISGTESDSDSILTPDIAATHATFNPPSASLMQPPLSSIAERSPGSGGEDSDEEEDLPEGDGAGWRPGSEGTKVIGVVGHPRGDDVVLKSGYLSKKGERRKTWKKRWFVLRPTHLAFYKNEAEYKLLRLLDLNDVHSCIPVYLKRHSNAFGLILPKRTYYLQAGSQKDVSDWVEAIEDARHTLMATSTTNSAHNAPTSVPTSTPIPIPGSVPVSSLPVQSPPPMSSSPNNQNPVSSSDSEDALSQLVPPPPLNITPGTGGGGPVAPSPTSVSFLPLPKPSPASPAPQKETSKIILSGYLMKCGSKRRNWRKRWFVLTAEKLFYSRSHMDTKPHRVFSFSDILDAMDYDLPKHRNQSHSTHHHHAPPSISPSISTSPPSHLSTSLGGSSAGANATSAHASNPAGIGTSMNLDLDSSNQQRNFTFKIVMTKRNLLLCSPSEEDEIKWLGAVRALIARRSGSGVLPGQQQQQQYQVGGGGAEGGGVGVGGSVPAAVAAGAGGGGIKSKVKRLSAGTGVLGGGGGGGGKSSSTTTTTAPTTTASTTGAGVGGIDEPSRDAR